VVDEVRIDSGRGEKTTFVILAAQSVKNTDTAEQKGYPHAIVDVTDRASASVAFSNHLHIFAVTPKRWKRVGE